MRRPGNLHGIDDYWFKQPLGEVPSAPKKILHPDIYQYNPHHISPNFKKGVTEVAEQIYTFELFTPEFCKKLIEESEYQGGWKTEITQEDDSLSGFGMMKINLNDYKSLKTENEKDTTLLLSSFPKNRNLSLVNTVNKTSELHVKPLIEKLWQSFTITKYDMPYMLKYDPIHVKKMNLHYDLETVALIVYLNTDYEGGGTYFPRWNFRMQPKKPGQAAMWPGGVSHEHIGLPITKGLRYLLCCAYF